MNTCTEKKRQRGSRRAYIFREGFCSGGRDGGSLAWEMGKRSEYIRHFYRCSIMQTAMVGRKATWVCQQWERPRYHLVSPGLVPVLREITADERDDSHCSHDGWTSSALCASQELNVSESQHNW